MPGSVSHAELPLLSSNSPSPGQAKGAIWKGREVPFFLFLPWVLDLDKGEVGVKGRRGRDEELRRSQGSRTPSRFSLLE